MKGITSGSKPDQFIIKHAGSLGAAFGDINNEFKRQHPDIDIMSTGGGSASLVRDVINGIPCSILASADYGLIPELMFPKHATWFIIFASSRIVLRYSDQSICHDEINEKNWIEILQKKDVTFWHSDPNDDPGGYRALMVLQLAEKYYQTPGLYRLLMTPEHDRTLSRSNFQESARGYSFGYDLRLGSGNSKVLQLPDEINLSRRDLTEYYRQAEVFLSGKGPGESFSLRGTPILFGITVPEICSDKTIAFEWLNLLLNDFGRMAMEKAGLTPIYPAIANDINKIPQLLRIRVQ